MACLGGIFTHRAWSQAWQLSPEGLSTKVGGAEGGVAVAAGDDVKVGVRDGGGQPFALVKRRQLVELRVDQVDRAGDLGQVEVPRVAPGKVVADVPVRQVQSPPQLGQEVRNVFRVDAEVVLGESPSANVSGSSLANRSFMTAASEVRADASSPASSGAGPAATTTLVTRSGVSAAWARANGPPPDSPHSPKRSRLK